MATKIAETKTTLLKTLQEAVTCEMQLFKQILDDAEDTIDYQERQCDLRARSEAELIERYNPRDKV